MAVDALVKQLGDAWGWILLRGLASIAFGVLAVLWPGLTIVVLVVLWGAWAFVDGVTSLATAWKARDEGKPVWPLVLIEVLVVGAGIVAAMSPGLTAVALLTFIAWWAVVMGVFQVIHAIRVRKAIEHEWMLILSGVVSVLFGAFMLTSPTRGALAVVWMISVWSIAFGVMLASAAIRIKRARDAS